MADTTLSSIISTVTNPLAPLFSRAQTFASQDIKRGLIVALAAWLLVKKAGFRTLFTSKKQLVIFAPSFLYDLITRVAFFPNWAICGLCYLQPELSEWNEPTSITPEQLKKAPGEPVEQIRQDILAHKDRAYKEMDIVRLFDACEPASAQTHMLNRTWHGKILRTNSSVLDLAEWFIIRPLSYLGLAWGKRYRTQHTGDPLLFNINKTVYFPIPLWGNVCMTNIEWRGRSLATMNYDAQPWKDYFSILSKPTPQDPNAPTVMLGVWTSKDKAGGWFTLTLDEDVPTN